MSWVKLDDQFWRNPKIAAAGKDAACLYLAGLCYSASQLTDGRIPKAALRAIAADPGVKTALAATLVVNLLWTDRGDHYEINGYHEYNTSADQVKKEREQARLRMQALRSARRSPEHHPERSPEHEPNNGRSSASPSSSRPTDVVKSSSQPTLVDPPASDDDDRLQAVVALIADRRIAALATPPTTPRAYHRKVSEDIRTELGERVTDLLERHPDRTPDRIAELVEPAPGSGEHRPILRDQRPPCDTCNGAGMVELDSGATTCPDCR